MSYPDDRMANGLRTLNREVSLTLNMIAETAHDNPELVAAVFDADEMEEEFRMFVDFIIQDHANDIPIRTDLLDMLVWEAMANATDDGGVPA